MDRIESVLQNIFIEICKAYLDKYNSCTIFLDYYCQKIDYNSVLIGLKEMGFKYYLLENRLTIYCT